MHLIKKFKQYQANKLSKVYESSSYVNEALSIEQKKVEKFLNSIAKEFDYSVQDAARFVISTIKKMGLNEGTQIGKETLIEDSTKFNHDEFGKIPVGKSVKYMGAEHKVISNDGYVLNLKSSDGKDIKVNLNQFNEKGAILEGRSIEKIEKERVKVISDMSNTVAKWKSAKETGDTEAEKTFLQTLKDLTTKKNELEKEVTSTISNKDKFIELIIAEGEMSTKSFSDHWQELYNEDFFTEYPKIAKLIKRHPNVDKRTLSKWWEEIYDEDFKTQYSAMWDKLTD